MGESAISGQESEKAKEDRSSRKTDGGNGAKKSEPENAKPIGDTAREIVEEPADGIKKSKRESSSNRKNKGENKKTKIRKKGCVGVECVRNEDIDRMNADDTADKNLKKVREGAQQGVDSSISNAKKAIGLMNSLAPEVTTGSGMDENFLNNKKSTD